MNLGMRSDARARKTIRAVLPNYLDAPDLADRTLSS
jgi:hypothetical protein